MCLSSSDIDVWLMKEYGNDDSWTKVWSFRGGSSLRKVVPLKLFRNGDMLAVVGDWLNYCCHYFNSKTATFKRVNPSSGSNIVLYTPSIVRLGHFCLLAPGEKKQIK